MAEQNTHKLFFTVLLLALVFFIGRDSAVSGEEHLGGQVAETSLAQVVATPVTREVRAPEVAPTATNETNSTGSRPTVLVTASEPLNVFFRAASVEIPELQAHAALVADLESGQELFALNAYQRWPAASLAKLATAVITAQEIGLEKPIMISSTAVAAEGPAGDFGTGERYRARDLVRALISISSNDAAEALAEHYGRSGFIAKMNELARSLGMIQTNFADPAGLSSLNQSSPEDLRKLTEYIYEKHPDILAAARNAESEVQELNLGAVRALRSNNIFSGRADFLGGKTGYTEEAGGNLLSIFSYLHRPVFIVVLGSEDRFAETEKLLEWIKKSYAR